MATKGKAPIAGTPQGQAKAAAQYRPQNTSKDYAKAREIERMKESQLQEHKEREARKHLTESENANIDRIRALMQRERDLRQKQQGRYEGDTGDHNTGRNEATIYEHKRNR